MNKPILLMPLFGVLATMNATADSTAYHHGAVATATKTAMAPAAASQYVIVISVDGMGSEYVKPLLASGLTNELTAFKRFQTEGCGTLNARGDANFAITLPNHVSMMTGRGVNGTTGHNWTGNVEPGPTETLATNKGSYVASGFDVAHDNGLRTGIWSGKSKFNLFQQSYGATSGGPDLTGTDNGRDKIDYDNISAGVSAATLTTDFITRMNSSPYHYVFLHYQDPDATGHSSGWSTNPTSAFASTLKAVDTQIGNVLQMITNSPTLNGRTTVIITADHGGHGNTHGDTANYLDYTIPFYVWGAGTTAGGDLHTMNPTSRTAPGAFANPPYTGGQPVRNGDAANLALDLLGLGAVPGSTIDNAQDLLVTAPLVAGPDATFLSQDFSTDPVNYTLPGISSPFRQKLVTGSCVLTRKVRYAHPSRTPIPAYVVPPSGGLFKIPEAPAKANDPICLEALRNDCRENSFTDFQLVAFVQCHYEPIPGSYQGCLCQGLGSLG